MKITAETIVRKTKAFTTYSSNPIQYRDTACHNAMIDLDCADREALSMAELVTSSGTPFADLWKALRVLARDGYVTLENSPQVPAPDADTSFVGGDDENEVEN